MNRAQLNALLAAGVITLEQHQAAIKTISALGIVGTQPVIQLEVAASVTLAEDDAPPESSRTIVIDPITVYDTLINSHQMVIHTGALEPRDRVMLLRDHNSADPLGTHTEIDDDVTRIAFSIPEGENGDRALEEAANGLRSGASVGFTAYPDGYYFDENYVIHILRADLYEVSVCAIPGAPEAGVSSVAAALAATRKENTAMNRAQLAAALAAGTITQEDHDAALSAFNAIELAARGGTPAPAPAVPAAVVAALEAGPVLHEQLPAAQLQVNDRGLSLAQMTAQLAGIAARGNKREFRLALEDLLPADDAGMAAGAATRPEWMDELFTASDVRQPWIDAIGGTKPLDSYKAEGWRVGEKPEVEEYAGDKTEVSTSTFTTLGDDFTAFDFAAGWDVQRRFIDFGDGAYLTKFWGHVTDDYKRKLEAGIRSRLLVIAGNNKAGSPTTGGVLAILKKLRSDSRAIEGSNFDRYFLAANLFDELGDLKADDMPLWLRQAEITYDSVDTDTATIGKIRIALDLGFAAGQTAALDSRGFTAREKQIPQIQALDVAHGGVDLGFYGYGRLDDEDPRLIVKRIYTP